jgi:hypothetical protein
MIKNKKNKKINKYPLTKKTFFLHNTDDNNKTFLYNSITKTIRANHHIALTITSSAIATLLLNNNHTAHSKFKIPIPIHEASTYKIKKHKNLANVLIQQISSFIIKHLYNIAIYLEP